MRRRQESRVSPNVPRTLRISVATALLGLAVAASMAPALPDGRVYEQVTPVEKNGGDVGGPSFGGAFASAYGQSANDGDAITYLSFTSFGDAQSAPLLTQYVSTRVPQVAWSTHAISPPEVPTAQVHLYFPTYPYFTSDLSAAIVSWHGPALAADALVGYPNLYVRHADGSYSLVTMVAPPNVSPENYSVTFIGGSEDLSRVVFEANDALTAAAPASARSVYEWTGSGLRLVSVLPNGLPAASAGAADGSDDNFLNAVSLDGSRIFWTDGEGQLYVRENGTTTVKLNASQRSPSLGDGTAVLGANTPTGSRAVFTDATALTDEADDAGGGLYEYELESRSLRDLTPYATGNPEIVGVLGMSDGGDIVYFVARGALTAEANAGEDNLYVAQDGTVQFVATLSSEDGTDWTREVQERTVRLTPDGTHLLFLSQASLTGYNNTDAVSGNRDAELFLYSLGAPKPVCVSCNPSGARPLGPASIPHWYSPSHQPSVMTADGSKVFFNSRDALVPGDTNGRQDVYEWEDGVVELISTGTSSDISALVDISEEGRDVFFTTRSALVPQDNDESSDLYDARIDGGFAPAPPENLECEGEACRGPLSIPLVPPIAPTAELTGEEEIPPASSGAKVARRRTRPTQACKHPHHCRHHEGKAKHGRRRT
jgi:hypothetical protein